MPTVVSSTAAAMLDAESLCEALLAEICWLDEATCSDATLIRCTSLCTPPSRARKAVAMSLKSFPGGMQFIGTVVVELHRQVAVGGRRTIRKVGRTLLMTE